ncbi:class I SAM-dependent methyltransferase [Halocynthiibacter styelae]|uniref:class I SAM-dependent methyltransferase n=1 Tax=Halocynthiibacter styelae TaxID=2761955 RepID=UPI002B4B966E|nr:class I SAM-dependent methyltransferase [Paenihalocynthiibacter styelae]
MLSARLPLALENGSFVVPETGDILVFSPSVEDDLSDLPRDQVLILDDFFPDCETWKKRGYRVVQDLPETAAASVICMPRAKNLARHWLAQACAITTGSIAIDGAKTAGIDSIYKACKKLTAVSETQSRAHGKFFTLPDDSRKTAFTNWLAAPAEGPEGFITAPGVFSEAKVDKGSALLASVLPEKPGRRVADLGAGWGYLSAQILKSDAVQNLHLIEASHTALACARRNVTDPRAEFHWNDARQVKLSGPVDTVITNPPFHTGRAAEPALGQAFLTNAAKLLTPKGTLLVVANQGLPYERTLQELFRQVDQIALENGFKVLRALAPLAKPRPTR